MGLIKKSLSLKKLAVWGRKEQLSRWPWTGLKWKRLDFQKGIMDNLVFKVMYAAEAVYLVSTLCFFYLCCGCHI